VHTVVLVSVNCAGRMFSSVAAIAVSHQFFYRARGGLQHALRPSRFELPAEMQLLLIVTAPGPCIAWTASITVITFACKQHALRTSGTQPFASLGLYTVLAVPIARPPTNAQHPAIKTFPSEACRCSNASVVGICS
jgi:hypothetical protein